MALFKETVLDIVSSIPRGSIMTYGEVAAAAGVPRAYRAVGSIMANNMNAAVPCHRVVKTNRMLGAYNRGGTAQKRRLLEAEGVKTIDRNGKIFVDM